MAEEGAKTTLQIENIPKEAGHFFLSLYLEKILGQEVEVTYTDGEDVATAVVEGSNFDISSVQAAASKDPLSGQVIRITISYPSEDEPTSDYLFPRTPTTPERSEHSLWSLGWNASTPEPEQHGTKQFVKEESPRVEDPISEPFSSPAPNASERSEHSLWSMGWNASTPGSEQHGTKQCVKEESPRVEDPISEPFSSPASTPDFPRSGSSGDGFTAVSDYDNTEPEDHSNETQLSSSSHSSKSKMDERRLSDQGSERSQREDPIQQTSEPTKVIEQPKEPIQIPPEKWKLTESRLKRIAEQDDSFDVEMNSSSHTVTVRGDEPKLQVYEILATIVEVPYPGMSTELATLLQSEEGEKVMDRNNVDSTLIVRDDMVYLTVDSAMEAETLQKLKELIKDNVHQVLETHETFLQSKEWEDFSKTLSSKFVVIVKVNLPERQILLSGIEVDSAGRELDVELVRNATITDKVEVKPGIGRYLETQESPLLRIIEKAVKVTFKKGDPWLIELSGHVEEVQKEKEMLKKEIDNIVHDKKEINRPGTRSVFSSTSGVSILQGLEMQKSCVIEVEHGSDSKPTTKIADKGMFEGVKKKLQTAASYVPGLNMLLNTIQDGETSPPEVEAGSEDEEKESSLMSLSSDEDPSDSSDEGTSDPEATAATGVPKLENGEHLLLSRAGVKLSLFRGDITKYKADVLVNTPVADCKTFDKAGAVAKAFKQGGGEDLEQKYYAGFQEKKYSVISTPSSGQLQNICQQVYHLTVRSWNNRHTEKWLNTYIHDSLHKCVEEHKLSSMAFPTVGCGQLRYPVYKVAHCFEENLKKFADDGHSVKVTLVAYDQKTYDEMLDCFEPKKKYMRKRRTKPVRIVEDELPSEEEMESFVDLAKEAYVDSAAAVDSSVDSPTGSPTVSAHAGLVFHVFGKTKQLVESTLKEIDNLLDAQLSTDIIDHPEMSVLSDAVLQSIQKLNSESIAVAFDEQKHVVHVTGVSNVVMKCRKQVISLIEQSIKGHLSVDQTRLLTLAEDPSIVPSHWTKYDRKSMHHQQPKSSESKLVEEKEKNKLAKAVKTVLEKSWDHGVVGRGNDAKGLTHSNIKIKKIERLEHPRLWQEYNNKRQQFLKDAALMTRTFPPIAGLKGEAEITIRGYNLPELENLVHKEINEVFLLHGTTKENLGAIKKQGLDSRLGESAGMFGQGVYFAESSTKADQYADRKDRKVGDHHMILARVLLGNTCVCPKPDKMKRAPCVACEKADCRDCSEFHDSVIGINRDNGQRLLFREFVVYEKGMCYPEFVITYERI